MDFDVLASVFTGLVLMIRYKTIDLSLTEAMKLGFMLFRLSIVVIIDTGLYAVIAQVVERIHGKDEVVGSSPPIGTMNSKKKLI